MSIAAVIHRNVFGIHLETHSETSQRHLVQFINEHTVCYPAGSNIVIQDQLHDSYRFIPLSERSESLTALAVSRDGHWLAVAERAANAKPSIIIYDLTSYRKRKTLAFPIADVLSTDVTHLAFSSDGKYLVSQTNGPDWNLSYWAWDKARVMGHHQTISASQTQQSVSNISVNLYDASMAVVEGLDFFSGYRYAEGKVTPVAFENLDPHEASCHGWIKSGELIVGLANGKLLVYDDTKLKQTIEHDEGPIAAIHTLADGFIVASASKKLGIYSFMVDSGAKTTSFGKISELQLPDDFQQLLSFAMSNDESRLLCLSTSNQVIYHSFLKPKQQPAAPSKSDDNLKSFQDVVETTPPQDQPAHGMETIQEKKTSADAAPENTFKRLLQPMHHGRITGMDVCIRKPLIATCSSDKSVRIWNYVDNECLAIKYFGEEASTVAIHPSGLYIIVGFNDKLRMMALLNDDMRTFKEYPIRNCREACFARGGHLFAAVHGNTIQIYTTWMSENICNLKGHNGKIKSLYWSKDDSLLISCGTDGAVYAWSLSSMKRENENILKGCSYSSAICSPNSQTLYAVGSDKMIKEITDSQIAKEIGTDSVLTQIVLSHSGNMMFAGTHDGAIRSIKFPLGDADEYQEHRAHSSAVTKLRVSHDDQYLFSCAEDGCLYVFRIVDKEERAVRREKTLVFTDEILVTKSDLEEKRALMADLKSQIEELKVANEYQLRLKDMTFADKIREINDKYTQEMESLKITTAVLRTDRDKEETRHVQELHIVKEKHAYELHNKETEFNQKLMLEFEKYQDLQQRAVELQEQWERKVRDKEDLHKTELGDVTDDNEAKMRMKASELSKLQDEMRQQHHEFEEIRRQTEEDIDSEIQNVIGRYEKKLKGSKDEGLRLKGENGIMRKKFNTLYKEIDDMKLEKQRLGGEQRKLQDVIHMYEKEVNGLKKEIQERDEFIQDKEKRVYELKKSNQELEKYKFVLDYKIRDLKQQIEPKENDINDMSIHIQGLSKELEDYYAKNLELEGGISEFKKKLSKCKKSYLTEKQKHKNVEKIINSFKCDLEMVMDHFQASPSILQKNFKKLHKKYSNVETEGDDLDSVDLEVKDEVGRQRDCLRSIASGLRRSVKVNHYKFKKDESERIKENERIIRQLVDIRKTTRLQIKDNEIERFEKIMSAANSGSGRAQPTKNIMGDIQNEQPRLALLPSITSNGEHVVTAAMK